MYFFTLSNDRIDWNYLRVNVIDQIKNKTVQSVLDVILILVNFEPR